jgi:hypothetical protein
MEAKCRLTEYREQSCSVQSCQTLTSVKYWILDHFSILDRFSILKIREISREYSGISPHEGIGHSIGIAVRSNVRNWDYRKVFYDAN